MDFTKKLAFTSQDFNSSSLSTLYVPLNGTTVGNPLSGDIEVSTGTALSGNLNQYYIGNGNNLDLSLATLYSSTRYNTSGSIELENKVDNNGGSKARLHLTSNLCTLESENGGTTGYITLTNSLLSILSSNSSFAITIGEGIGINLGITTGTKIGKATSQKLGFWNATPVIQPTTAVSEATFVANTSINNLYKESTFDGYTISQIVKALRNIGLLA